MLCGYAIKTFQYCSIVQKKFCHTYPVKRKVLKYSNLALSGSVKLPTLICLMY